MKGEKKVEYTVTLSPREAALIYAALVSTTRARINDPDERDRKTLQINFGDLIGERQV